MINQCFLYLPLDGGGREGLGAVVVVVVVVVVVAGPAVFMRNDSIIFIMINMTQSYDKSNNPAEDYLECLYLPGIAVISNPTLVTELSV